MEKREMGTENIKCGFPIGQDRAEFPKMRLETGFRDVQRRSGTWDCAESGSPAQQ